MSYKRPPRRQVGLDFTGEISATQQQFKDECNLSAAVNRWLKHGKPPANLRENPLFLDCTQIGDYAESLETAAQARDMLLALPSDIRKKMNNDPSVMLDILARNDPKELAAYGLLELHEIPKNPPPSPAEPSPAGAAPSGAKGSGA